MLLTVFQELISNQCERVKKRNFEVKIKCFGVNLCTTLGTDSVENTTEKSEN